MAFSTGWIILLAVGLCATVCVAQAVPTTDMPAYPELPDPLVMADGSRITTVEQWQKRRTELREMFQTYMYGHFPPAPGNVVGEVIHSEPRGDATFERVRLRFGPEQKLTINLSLVIPRGEGPLPVMLYLHRGNRLPESGMMNDWDLPVSRGYIFATFANADLVTDVPRQREGAMLAYPDYDWAVLAVWAWGMQRCVDYLQTRPEVAKDRIAVCGHSRRGKACLLAAAFDDRIALAAPSGSGVGGTDASRGNLEGYRSITQGFACWFVPRYGEFAAMPEKLPVDQHMLIALMAPRSCLSKDALNDPYASRPGIQMSVVGALPVYKLHGIGTLGDKLGIHFRPGGHDITREDWGVILDFCDRNLLGKPTTTRFDHLPVPTTQP